MPTGWHFTHRSSCCHVLTLLLPQGAIVLGMIGFSYASVPLYRAFCQVGVLALSGGCLSSGRGRRDT
jgi:cytochrome c oxidase assembly protein Cox11